MPNSGPVWTFRRRTSWLTSDKHPDAPGQQIEVISNVLAEQAVSDLVGLRSVNKRPSSNLAAASPPTRTPTLGSRSGSTFTCTTHTLAFAPAASRAQTQALSQLCLRIAVYMSKPRSHTTTCCPARVPSRASLR